MLDEEGRGYYGTKLLTVGTRVKPKRRSRWEYKWKEKEKMRSPLPHRKSQELVCIERWRHESCTSHPPHTTIFHRTTINTTQHQHGRTRFAFQAEEEAQAPGNIKQTQTRRNGGRRWRSRELPFSAEQGNEDSEGRDEETNDRSNSDARSCLPRKYLVATGRPNPRKYSGWRPDRD